MARPNRLLKLFPAQESIDFQPTEFFNELTTLISCYRTPQGRQNIKESEVTRKIELIVQNQTGITISIVVDDIGPAMQAPFINKNNVLWDDTFREFMNNQDIVKSIHDLGTTIHGSVNLRTGKVTGYWSDIPISIYMPEYWLTGSRYTPEETAAAFLHELGHAFTFFEYISRTTTTNQVLSLMSKGLMGAVDAPQREAILMSVKTKLALKDFDVKELSLYKNSDIAEIVVITEVTQRARSELGWNIFDINSWEALSDDYASRYGAGRYLISALAKDNRGITSRSLPVYLGVEAIKLICVGLAPFTGLASFYVFLAMAITDCEQEGVYSTPSTRLQRIRSTLVLRTKDLKVGKEEIKSILEDIEIIDGILNTVHERRQFFGVVLDFLIPSLHKARDLRMLQKNLEKLSTNDLYVKAAELRTMAATAKA